MINFLKWVFYGGVYKVVHVDACTGKRKVFWCNTWQDALEWTTCALNEDAVIITDYLGYTIAQRGA